MFYQLKDRVRRYRFAKACKGVLQASPVAPDASSNLVVLSQVQHKDVLLFLLAVKSFARQVRPRTVCVLNDGSLSANDRAVLREHIPGVNLLELAEFRSAVCPRGGTWERLLAIASLVRDHYVIQLDSDTRIRNLRSDMGLSNSISILSTMAASWALDDFAALYLSIGACNELSTATAYGALARNCQHPVLVDLLGRIQKDERRHFAFYFNSAKDWMTDSPRAQWVARIGMKFFWQVVGQGLKTQEEVDAISLYLFDDEEGKRDVETIDEKMGRLPGLSGIRLMTRAREDARRRNAQDPAWGWRLIDNEEWAKKSVAGGTRLYKGQLVGTAGFAESEELA